MVSKNSEKYISQSIKSVLAQSFKDWELIIVDNGSKDKTEKVIKSFLPNKKIRFFKLKIANQPRARNLAIKKSKGDFIAILDSDDIALKTRFMKQFNYLKKNPKIGLLGTSAIVINDKGNVLGNNDYPLTNSEIKYSLFFGTPFCHSSIIFRKKLNIFYNEKFLNSQDRDLYNRLFLRTDFQNLKERLVKYRSHNKKTQKEKNKKKNQIKYERKNLNNISKFILKNKMQKSKILNAIIKYRHFREIDISNAKIIQEYIALVLNYLQNQFILTKDEINKIKKLASTYWLKLCFSVNINVLQKINLFIKNEKLANIKMLIFFLMKKAIK